MRFSPQSIILVTITCIERITDLSTEIVPYGDIERMAVAIAKSNLFGMKTPEQACALMLIAQAEGLHPAVAARDYHVIDGRPALKADAMLARYQAAGGKVEWLKYSDQVVSGRFTHPLGGTVVITWTIQQAQLASLTGKPTWKHYPRAMLRARVISEGVRATFPGVSVGIYTPEEIESQPNERNITPSKLGGQYDVETQTDHPKLAARSTVGTPDAGGQAPAAPPPPPPPASVEEIAAVAALAAESGITPERLSAWIFGASKGLASKPEQLTGGQIQSLIKKLKEKAAEKRRPEVIEGTIIPDGYTTEEIHDV
jgi:hypothetical protein